MIATHMNAPYGKIVSAQDVVASLENGRLTAANATSNAILEALFTEVTPGLILKCAQENNVPLAQVQALYKQTLTLGLRPSRRWEAAVGACA